MRQSVTKRDLPRTDEYNAFLRTQRQFAREQPLFGRGFPVINRADSQTIAWCLNSTGSNLLHGQVVGVDFDANAIEPDFDGWHEVLMIIGEIPATGTHEGSFGVTQEPIPAGEIGRVCVAGATRCRLSVTSSTDTFAEIANGVTSKLTTSTSGSAKVLYKQTGTGDKWGIVRLGQEASSGSIVRFAAAAGSTSISGTTPTVVTLTNLQGFPSGTFSLSSGTVICNTAGEYWIALSASVTVPYTRNESVRVEVYLESRKTSGGVWARSNGTGGMNLYVEHTTYHPDVAVVHSAEDIWAAGNIISPPAYDSDALTTYAAGHEFRVVYDADVASSLPAGISLNAVELMFGLG